jgi:putative nucleotidyltransferase with HDIG domain
MSLTSINEPLATETKHIKWKTLPPRCTRPFLLLVAIASLTGSMGQRFYHQPKLDEGTVAPETIISPANAKVLDPLATEEKRKLAAIGAISMLKVDQQVNERIQDKINFLLNTGTQLRERVGPFPFISTDILSQNSQLYLLQISMDEWQKILKELNIDQISNQNLSTSTFDHAVATSSYSQQIPPYWLQKNKKIPSKHLFSSKPYLAIQPDEMENYKSSFIKELNSYRQRASASEFIEMINIINNQKIVIDLVKQEINKINQDLEKDVYDIGLFNISPIGWDIVAQATQHIAEKMLVLGIPKGLSREQWLAGLRLQVKDEVLPPQRRLVFNILDAALEPNLVKDQEATQQLAEVAAQNVSPIEYTIHIGEVIVKAGEKIDRKSFLLLDYFNLSRRRVNWFGLIAYTCLITGSIVLILLVKRHFRPGLRRRDYILLLLLSLSTPLMLTFGIGEWPNLAAVGLLAGSFYGSAIAMMLVGLISFVLPLGMEVNHVAWFANIAGGLVAGWRAEKLRSREELALLGLTIGATQGTVNLLATLIVNASGDLIWYAILPPVGLQFLGGLAWSVIALGLSPYLEHLFDLITPIRLSELSNPNRPLLKRLASEAPGTFQHTLFVASLAEAAARELGGNVELVRAGTLYHDIGKMHDPMAFIENQMDTLNKHDQINNPWMSANLIKRHVTEGIVMAKKYRLPKAIRAFIPEHQGTMQIVYFYYQAQQLAKNDPSIIVKEEDFRYPGPIPQSLETGILMLADSCEAALRSLKEVSHEEALQTVKKIMKARWQDHQLDDCGLTKEDLLKIAEIFVQVWEQYNHKRIAYPKALIKSR